MFIIIESDKVLVAVVSDASGGDWGFSDSSCYSDRYKLMVRKDQILTYLIINIKHIIINYKFSLFLNLLILN